MVLIDYPVTFICPVVDCPYCAIIGQTHTTVCIFLVVATVKCGTVSGRKPAFDLSVLR